MKKRRRKHYHTGVYVSTKTGQECQYRSGWELAYLQHLDADPTVVSYQYEGVCILYLSNRKTGKMRKYWPDFLVEYTDGKKIMVEIKPKKRLDQTIVKKKLAAARQWCGEHGATLEIVTEVELKALCLLK